MGELPPNQTISDGRRPKWKITKWPVRDLPRQRFGEYNFPSEIKIWDTQTDTRQVGIGWLPAPKRDRTTCC